MPFLTHHYNEVIIIPGSVTHSALLVYYTDMYMYAHMYNTHSDALDSGDHLYDEVAMERAKGTEMEMKGNFAYGPSKTLPLEQNVAYGTTTTARALPPGPVYEELTTEDKKRADQMEMKGNVAYGPSKNKLPVEQNVTYEPLYL